VLVAAAAATAARVAASAPERHAGFSAALACGVERWNVKTLQDRPRLLPARPTTLAHLVSLARPSSLPVTRLPFERHIFNVVGAVTLVRPEDDQDLHLVLRRGASHMIAEAPSSTCTRRATAYRRRQMRNARRVVRLCARARVVGVAFFDYWAGATRRRAHAPCYLGMQPEVAAGETTTFPSTTSALTDDAPHMQGAWSRLAPVACADLNASTATAAAITRQTLTRGRRPQNLTTRGCRAASPSTMGRVAHLRPRRVLLSMRSLTERRGSRATRSGTFRGTTTGR
jgi:hypothetical protein